jgi:hypothetical protein
MKGKTQKKICKINNQHILINNLLINNIILKITNTRITKIYTPCKTCISTITIKEIRIIICNLTKFKGNCLKVL